MGKRTLLLCTILLFAKNILFGQGNWELKKKGEGVEIYTRKAAVGNIKEIRVLCQLDASEAQFINTLKDIPGYSEWVYSNKKSYVLKAVTTDKIIYYTQCHLPWPIKDRDLITELNIEPTPQVLNVTVKCLPQYLPKNTDFIRVPYSLAKWKVTTIADNKLNVDYTFSVDPGGSIPSWILNATMAIGPYNTFVKLKEIIKTRKY
jgi:hypothetical protein